MRLKKWFAAFVITAVSAVSMGAIAPAADAASCNIGSTPFYAGGDKPAAAQVTVFNCAQVDAIDFYDDSWSGLWDDAVGPTWHNMVATGGFSYASGPGCVNPSGLGPIYECSNGFHGTISGASIYLKMAGWYHGSRQLHAQIKWRIHNWVTGTWGSWQITDMTTQYAQVNIP